MDPIRNSNTRYRPPTSEDRSSSPTSSGVGSLSNRLADTHLDHLPRRRGRHEAEPEQPPPFRWAILQMPNGMVRPGTVRQNEDGADFHNGSPEDVMRHQQPGLKVEFVSHPDSADALVKPHLRCLPYPAVPEAAQATLASLFKRMTEVAGGEARRGVGPQHKVLHLNRLEHALEAIVDRAEAPRAVKLAIDALASSRGLGLNVVLQGNDYQLSQDVNRADFEDIRHLEPDQHLYLSIKQESRGAHALAVGVKRLDEGNVQLGIFNSNGWTKPLDGRRDSTAARRSAVFKAMTVDEAVQALKLLQGGQVLRASANENERNRWASPGHGAPLVAWLRQAGDGHADLNWADGAMVTPQKGNDCGLEVAFSWLANVVSKPDYKLAKVHVLNAYAVDAEALGVESEVSNRINHRLTSSLNGYLNHLDRPGVERGE